MHLFEAASTADARLAAEMLVRAGRRAIERLAYEDAAERFPDRAVQALELADAEEESGPALLARGDALLRAGEPEAARAAFTRARALALRRGDVTLLGGSAWVRRAGDRDRRPRRRVDRTAQGGAAASCGPRAALAGSGAPRSRTLLRTRPHSSDVHSTDAVGTARESGDAAALASALSARHVALWRPDRVEERLAVADEMIAAARESGDRHAELQAHNWRVADLFELGEMAAWREETARHARLAAELHLPSFEWYTPLWAAVDVMLAGRLEDAEALRLEAEAAGLRAGDRNAVGSAAMVRFCEQLQREAWHEGDTEFVADKIANSPAGIAYRGGYSWILAGLGESDRAREEIHATMALTHAFDVSCSASKPSWQRRASSSATPRSQQRCTTGSRRTRADRSPPAGPSAVTERSTDRSAVWRRSSAAKTTPCVTSKTRSASASCALGCVVWRARAERTYPSSSATGGSWLAWPRSNRRR